MSTYHEELQINKYELADLWEVHQDLFMKWAEQHADAIAERDKAAELLAYEKATAKDRLETISAELNLEIRENYANYGWEKPPLEKQIESWVRVQPDYKDALEDLRNVERIFRKRLINAEATVNKLKAAKEAFEHRKAALDNLTRLMIGGYYSSKLPKEIKEEVQERRSIEAGHRAQEFIGKEMKERKLRKETNVES